MTTHGARELWLDLARGSAVISMVIAHTCPVGGIFNVTEYLTAAWFGLVLGISLVYAYHHRRLPGPAFALAAVLRGGLLMGIGYAIVPIHRQVLIVLPVLGLTEIVVGALVPVLARRWWLAMAVAVSCWLLSPVVMTWAVSARIGSGVGAELVQLIGGGQSYRVITMAVWTLLGVAVAGVITSTTSRRWAGGRGGLGLGLLATCVVGGLHLLGRVRWGDGFLPYSGTRFETAHNGLLALTATWWCVVLAARTNRGLVAWVAQLGRWSLTAYVVQLVVLRLGVQLWLDGGRDDNWWLLLATIGVLLGLAQLWQRWGWVGPFEWLVRLPTRLLEAMLKAPTRNLS